MRNFILVSFLSICFLFSIYIYYKFYIDYYSLILKNAKIPDYTRWILSDKYIAKKYAELYGFSIPKTYQLVKYPQNIDFNKLPQNFVLKPVDLCDSSGVYLVKDGKNLQNGTFFNNKDAINNLLSIRSKSGSEYYIHENMFNKAIPFNGYIVEELLLDSNGDIPYDYKCYVFDGKIHFIAITFNRKIKDGKQIFNSMWLDRNWKPYRIPMIKINYKFDYLKKPKHLDKLISIVEKMSKILKRHCRIDVYLINGKVYFGEYTFFCGAILHTFICNMILGIIWLIKKDNYEYNDKQLNNLTPSFYNKI